MDKRRPRSYLLCNVLLVHCSCQQQLLKIMGNLPGLQCMLCFLKLRQTECMSLVLVLMNACDISWDQMDYILTIYNYQI